MSQSKIKTLFKIFYIRSKFIFTIFFFLTGVGYHSEIFASDDLPGDGIRQALLSGQRSPELDTRHSLNGDDDTLIDVTVRSPAPAEEDLLAEIDTTAAEDKMNEIIHCLAYRQGDEARDTVIALYPHIDRCSLEDHLAKNAWSAATEGPLTEILRELVGRTGKLQNKHRELQGQIEELKENAKIAGTKSRCLKIALGSVMTASLAGYAAMLLLWHPWR